MLTFLNSFEKTAKEHGWFEKTAKKKRRQNIDDTFKNVASTVAAGVAGNWLAAMSYGLSDKVMGGKKTFSFEGIRPRFTGDAEKILEHMIDKKIKPEVSKGDSSFFSARRNYVSVAPSSAIGELAHELGHYQQSARKIRIEKIMERNSHREVPHRLRKEYLKSFPSTVLRDISRMALSSPLVSLGVPALSTYFLSKGGKNENENKNNLKNYAPLALSGLISAPVLLEEAGASARGLNAIRKTHGLKEMLKHTPTLTSALATYAYPVMAGAAGTYLLNKRNKKEKK